MTAVSPTVKPDALYFVDNGACYCGAHLGASARYTGRDISGQRIQRATRVAAALFAAAGLRLACEACGKGLAS